MAKKYKASVLSESDEKYLSSFSKKERKIAVSGKPDRRDIENLAAIFESYDKHTGGRLKRMVEQNRVEKALRSGAEPNLATVERFSFFMPQDLQNYLETLFPTLWTNKEHVRWFLKYFPQFRR